LVICINPNSDEFEENLNVLKFAEDAQNIQCKREMRLDIDIEAELNAKQEKIRAEKKKNRRKTILEAWNVNEDALSLSPSIPSFELFDINDQQILPNMINILRLKTERREIIDEECGRMSNNFRKKLSHYEREGVEAVSKLRLIEPQFAKNEGTRY